MEDPTVLLDVLKVFGLAAFAFFVAFFSTPLLTYYLYRNRMWSNETRRDGIGGGEAKIVGNILRDRVRENTPLMGGVLVWGTVLFITFLFWVLGEVYDGPLFSKLNFLSRNQTWLPVAGLLAGALVGFIDDWMKVKGVGGHWGGLEIKKRIVIVSILGAIGAWWFYGPLGVSSILVPFVGEIELGVFFIPLFVITMLAVFSSGVVDGLDGLAGGVLGAVIAAYGGIAFFQNQLDLAAFLGVAGGALLAFLWYNIPPARFYLSETGTLSLTVMLTIIVFLTKAVAVLPIIAFPLVMESGSVIIQVASKKFRGKKVFLAAPIHHHFEAKGWPHYKVTMRFWVVSLVMAIVGMVVHLIGTQ